MTFLTRINLRGASFESEMRTETSYVPVLVISSLLANARWLSIIEYPRAADVINSH